MPTFKSVGELHTERKFQTVTNETPVGIRTPLSLGTKSDGIFAMHFSTEAQIQDNFRNLLLTNHGERLGFFDYGANLRPLTSELSSEELESEVANRIRRATSKYMPFISLQTFEYQIDNSQNKNTAKIRLRIIYNVPALNIQNKGMELTFYLIG
jgi:phage baseplate assembly protein W